MKTYWAIEDKKGRLVEVGLTPEIFKFKSSAEVILDRSKGERPVKVEIRKVEEKK